VTGIRSREDKSIVPEIKRRIAAVDRPVMVRTDEHEICQRVITSPAEPTDVMRFTYLGPITAPGCPPADLALTRVEVSELFN
jgi:hypothetical protein